jgi:hypothetical protein
MEFTVQPEVGWKRNSDDTYTGTVRTDEDATGGIFPKEKGFKAYADKVDEYYDNEQKKIDTELAALGAIPSAIQGTIDFGEELTPEEKAAIGSQPKDNVVDDINLKQRDDKISDNADDIFVKEDPDEC